jgi:hypothetical protein
MNGWQKKRFEKNAIADANLVKSQRPDNLHAIVWELGRRVHVGIGKISQMAFFSYPNGVDDGIKI